MIIRIHNGRQSNLLQIIGAFDGLRLGLGTPQSGQKHASQNGDNSDHDQQFDQSETFVFHGIRHTMPLESR